MSTETKVSVPSIVCGGCASAIKQALGNVQGVAHVDVDTTAKTVTVKHAARVERVTIINALEGAGFPVARDSRTRERSRCL